MRENHPGNISLHRRSHFQMPRAESDSTHAAEAGLGNAEPNATQALSPNTFRPTSNFPADPSRLTLPQLEDHYRAMRRSHKFLVRSRAQLMRRSRENRKSRQDLLDTIHYYQEQYSVIGRERVEEFELARELKQKLEAFEKNQQEFDQLLSQVEDVHGEGGFWSFLRVTELLKRMRELLVLSGFRQ